MEKYILLGLKYLFYLIFILLCAELVGPPGLLIGVIIIRLLSGTIIDLIKKSAEKK